MSNYRRIVAFNMCLHMLVLCSIYNQCTDTFSLLFHATTTCPIQMPACYKKRVLASTKSISNSLFSKTLILIILVADFSLWLSILLLYCGDIHPNIGPFSSSSDSFDSSNTPGPSFSSINLNQNLSFVHYNVQGIVNKLDILHAELLDFDILAFTETWLSPAVSANDLMLQSYNIPERKARTGDPHGGVIVYVKNGIFYKRREDLEIRGLECLWIEVINPRRRILFELFYRAPNSDTNYYNNIEDSVSLAADTGIKDIVITGDFYLNYLNNTSKRKIDLLCMHFSLYQSISQPTHFTEHYSSLIDIILVSNKENLILSGVADPFLNQDVRFHCPVYGVLKFSKPKSKAFVRHIWSYENGNYELLREKASAFDWQFLENDDLDIDIYANNINSCILSLAAECIPNKHVRIKPLDPHWLTATIKCNIRKRKRAYKKPDIQIWMHIGLHSKISEMMPQPLFVALSNNFMTH